VATYIDIDQQAEGKKSPRDKGLGTDHFTHPLAVKIPDPLKEAFDRLGRQKPEVLRFILEDGAKRLGLISVDGEGEGRMYTILVKEGDVVDLS